MIHKIIPFVLSTSKRLTYPIFVFWSVVTVQLPDLFVCRKLFVRFQKHQLKSRDHVFDREHGSPSFSKNRELCSTRIETNIWMKCSRQAVYDRWRVRIILRNFQIELESSSVERSSQRIHDDSNVRNHSRVIILVNINIRSCKITSISFVRQLLQILFQSQLRRSLAHRFNGRRLLSSVEHLKRCPSTL